MSILAMRRSPTTQWAMYLFLEFQITRAVAAHQRSVSRACIEEPAIARRVAGDDKQRQMRLRRGSEKGGNDGDWNDSDQGRKGGG